MSIKVDVLEVMDWCVKDALGRAEKARRSQALAVVTDLLLACRAYFAAIDEDDPRGELAAENAIRDVLGRIGGGQ